MITLPELLDTNECKTFLQFQQKRIKSPNLRVTASMIMKKYAQTYLNYCFDSMLWESEIKIIPLTACQIGEQLDLKIDHTKILYSESRLESWENLFAKHLTQVVLTLHQTTRLPLNILWENVAVRINSYFRKSVQNYPNFEERIKKLYKELHELDGYYFDQDTHPMTLYLVPFTSLTQQRTRCTCCFFYKLEKEKELSHCLVCPIKGETGTGSSSQQIP